MLLLLQRTINANRMNDRIQGQLNIHDLDQDTADPDQPADDRIEEAEDLLQSLHLPSLHYVVLPTFR